MDAQTTEGQQAVRFTAVDDVPVLLTSARKAAEAWRSLPLSARLRALAPVKGRLLSRANEIAATIAEETGKPHDEALLAEVLACADLFDHWLGRAEDIFEPEEIFLDPISYPGKSAHVHREPRGVVALITPWNYPCAIPLRTLVPALVAGNAVVFKPSEVTARVGAAVASLFEGLPYGVLTLVQGDAQVGASLVAGDVDLVVFTGSVRGGKAVARACAERLVPCSLELGGKDPAIVLADADVERAAAGVVWGALTNAGQNCASIERVYVEAPIAERFIGRVVELVRGLRPEIDVGRLTTEGQRAIVERQVSEAIEAGAEVLAGGTFEPGSLLVQPVVLRVHDERTPLMRDETFGPVIPIVVVGSVDEAITRANDCRYGLTASIWTKHTARAQQLAAQLRVGVVTINNHGFTAALPQAPWSGVGETGPGVTNSTHALAELTRPKMVLTDTNPAKRELYWYPYTPALRRVAEAMIKLRGGGGLAARVAALFSLLASFPRRLMGG